MSIGAGNCGLAPLDADNMLAITKKIATDTEDTARAFVERWRSLISEERRYFRFNVEQGLQDISSEQHEKRSIVETATEYHFQNQEQAFLVGRCARMLLGWHTFGKGSRARQD